MRPVVSHRALAPYVIEMGNFAGKRSVDKYHPPCTVRTLNVLRVDMSNLTSGSLNQWQYDNQKMSSHVFHPFNVCLES